MVVTWTAAAGAIRYGVLVNRTGKGAQQRYVLPAQRRSLRICRFPPYRRGAHLRERARRARRLGRGSSSAIDPGSQARAFGVPRARTAPPPLTAPAGGQA